jgi:microcompartment protein CcmL/EutN
MDPALGVLELSSIARGVIASDAMAKKAPIRILQTHPISPGKHLVVIAGGVAEVDESLAIGIAVAGGCLVDRLLLAQAHESLVPLIEGTATPAGALDSVGIFETFTVCSTIVAADAAAKAARVTLIDLRLGAGIGGKAFFTMSGRLEEVEAAALAGRNAIESGLLVGIETIPAPHEDLRRRLFW